MVRFSVKLCTVFVGNVIDVMLMCDHDDNASLFPDSLLTLAIFTSPKTTVAYVNSHAKV